MPQQTYNWKRFWCPRERNFSLADFGYLYDPDTEYGKHINPDVVSFERIADIPCLILLGEPGIGKSSALQTEKDDISAKIKQQGHTSIHLNLRSFGSEDRLIRSLFEHETFKSWKDSSHRLYLFLDSFDECLLRIDTLSTLLADELSNHSSQIQRLYLRIASRTADWSLALENRFINLWGKDSVRAYKLAPLRRKDVEEAANAENIETESFVETIRQNEAVPLAIKPITLGFLLGIYKSKGGFPERKIDLYLDGCLEICKEPPESNRREAKLLGNLDPEIRLAIAGKIAALTIFCNRSAILRNWGQDQLLPEDITFREIWGGEEIVKEINYPVNEKAIEEVIGTGLFSDRGINRLGFAHQNYAEFLAAWYVAEHRNLPLVQIMSLFTTPEDPEKHLVPQLHETAAWITSMRQDVLTVITQTDPDVILWFKSIEFGSDEAVSEQSRYQEIQESAKLREINKKRKPSDEEIKERINYYLNEFDAGKLDAWRVLNRQITLNPNSPYYDDLDIDLTDCYGWKSADPATKIRIINAAKEYLKLQNSCSNNWIGITTYNLASLAGCRGLYLLLKEEPIFLTQISASVWTNWTPAIVAFPPGRRVRENTNLQLLELAYSHAPTDFINTLLLLIDADNKRSSYLFSLDKLGKCWDERLKNALLDKVKVLDLEPKCISQLLEELIKVNHEQSRDFAKSLLSWLGEEDRQRAIFVAQVLLKQAQEFDWDMIWHTITKDLDFTKESLEEIGSYGLQNLTLNLNEKQLAVLYIWLECNYPRTEDPVYDTAHFVESRESVANFRDGVLTQLRETGTRKACQEIQRIIEHFPNYDLKWHLIKAQSALRKKCWKPPEPKELMQLVNNSDKRLIQDGNQLLDVIIEALDKKFHDQTSSAIDLWNEVKWGQIRHLADSLSKHLNSASSFSDLFEVNWRKVPKTKDNTYLPKEEERVSDYIVRYLRDFLNDRAILSNREVVIRDQDRVDILVEIAVKNEKIEVYDRIAVIIEAKGCWNSGLNNAMQTQLVDRYLKENNCQFGLYLIAWFNCNKWDESDTRKATSPKISLEQAREQFSKQAESLSQGGVNVKSFVLNASLR